MKLTRFTCLIVVGLLLSIAASGCRKKPVGVSNIPNQALAHVPDMDTMPPISPGPEFDADGMDDAATLSPLVDPSMRANWINNAEVFKANTIYFGFDSSAVRSDEKSKVASVADYLKASTQDAVRVEGHCDERGTEEYNRALGERRALAIRDELIRLGIDSSRVDTLSFGEDRPMVPEANEAAWRQNRRGEFILLSPPR
jgi:peptidoglycan-associated lipoprotein